MVELEYKSDFLEVSYDSENSWIISKWTSSTQHLTVDQYRPEILALAKVFRDHHPFVGSLSLTQDFNFIVDPELQDWVTQQFNDYLPPKSAMVVAAEFISQLSIEQTVQNMETALKYFDNEPEAREWLLGKETKVSKS
ncbi:hypothetical protein [Microscilla marina]|uniref:STAS/SEC14 domain-containing protein n=1 Tax=Microscilla marina ATCC 23134 TaxID=313606 RepID=A1ZGD5_MICM2|nr:hypothetical protein [Microscilla marina]EAY30552.1 hypothetical protein M23134_03190 [Microscilla marina ATCC 23134]